MTIKKTILSLLPNELDTALHLYAESPTFRALFSFQYKPDVEALFRTISENYPLENDVLAYLEKNADKLSVSENGEVDIIRALSFIGERFDDVRSYLRSSELSANDYPYKIGDTVTLGHETLPSDRAEPKEWLVLDIDRAHRRALLLSEHIAEFGTHLEDASNSKETKYLWSNSMINRWLNTEFVRKSGLSDIESRLVAVDHITRGTEFTPDEITDEKIFILSRQECEKYFPYVPYYNSRETRIATAYKDEKYIPCQWWLRDPNRGRSNLYNGTSVFFVDSEGYYLHQHLKGFDGRCLRGIRPVMWLEY